MINSKRAFTFVELLISILIMSLLAVIGVGSFQAFFSNQQITRIQENISNIKRGLDADIEAGNISSYSLTFGSGSSCLIANIDFYNSPQIIRFKDFDYSALSGSLETNNTSTGYWETKIYIDNSFSKTIMSNGSGSEMVIDFGTYSGFETIKINSKIDDIPTNNYIFYRLDYSKDESENTQNSYFTFLSGAQMYDVISVENILGKKQLITKKGMFYSSDDSVDVALNRYSSELIFTIKP